MKAQRDEKGRYVIDSPTDRTRIVLDPESDDYEALAPDVGDLPEAPDDDGMEPEGITDPPAIAKPAEPVHYKPVDEEDSWLTWK